MDQYETFWLRKTIFLGMAILVFLSFGSSAKPAFAQSAPANFDAFDALDEYISA